MLDLIPPRTDDENQELMRLWDQHDAFNAWVSNNYRQLDDPDSLDMFAYIDVFNSALGHWQAEKLGEIRTGTLEYPQAARLVTAESGGVE